MTRYRRTAPLAEVEQPDVVYLAALPSGPPVVLDGIARALWQEVADGPELAEVVATLGTQYDVPPAELEASLREFVGDLVSRGVLQPVTD